MSHFPSKKRLHQWVRLRRLLPIGGPCLLAPHWPVSRKQQTKPNNIFWVPITDKIEWSNKNGDCAWTGVNMKSFSYIMKPKNIWSNKKHLWPFLLSPYLSHKITHHQESIWILEWGDTHSALALNPAGKSPLFTSGSVSGPELSINNIITFHGLSFQNFHQRTWV